MTELAQCGRLSENRQPELTNSSTQRATTTACQYLVSPLRVVRVMWQDAQVGQPDYAGGGRWNVNRGNRCGRVQYRCGIAQYRCATQPHCHTATLPRPEGTDCRLDRSGRLCTQCTVVNCCVLLCTQFTVGYCCVLSVLLCTVVYLVYCRLLCTVYLVYCRVL